MDRRQFLGGLAAGLVATGQPAADSTPHPSIGVPFVGNRKDAVRSRSAATTTEVVGDGKWIWRKPPDGVKGLAEPRQFEFGTEIRMQATGDAHQITSTTVVPVPLPEQRVDDFTIETQGCKARLRQLTPECGQMILYAPLLRPGQILYARARFQLTLLKQFFNYQQDQFPTRQQFSKRFSQVYMRDTKGIRTRSRAVRDLAGRLSKGHEHPWQKAREFKKWVWENISSDAAMRYTGVDSALRSGNGDCEERSAVFCALCRVSGIPARTVWVPNHVWAEFCLHDEAGKLHWIPAHTSGYTWFGLTGAHELVMQKGEGIRVPEQRKKVRFVHDWTKWTGPRPRLRYTSLLRPLTPDPTADAGPGTRIKPVEGPWKVGNHPLDKYLLNGDDTKKSPFRAKRAEVAPWE